MGKDGEFTLIACAKRNYIYYLDMAEDNANEKVKIEVPRQYIQIILQALDVTNRQEGLRSAEALVVIAKE